LHSILLKQLHACTDAACVWLNVRRLRDSISPYYVIKEACQGDFSAWIAKQGPGVVPFWCAMSSLGVCGVA